MSEQFLKQSQLQFMCQVLSISKQKWQRLDTKQFFKKNIIFLYVHSNYSQITWKYVILILTLGNWKVYVAAPSRFNFGPFCVPFNGQSWDIAIWAIGDCGENYSTVLLTSRREERNFQWEVAVIDWAYIGLFVMFMSSCTIPIIHADLIKWIAFWSLNFWEDCCCGWGEEWRWCRKFGQ